MVAIKLDATEVTAAYSTVLRRLANLTGFDQRAVLIAEAGSILKTWAARTKVQNMDWAERRERRRVMHDLELIQAPDRGNVTVNAGWRAAPYGRVWLRVRKAAGPKSFLLAMGPNFTSPVGPGVFNKFARKQNATTQGWVADIAVATQSAQNAVAKRLPLARQSVGLARNSIVQIADSLGIDLLRVPGGGVSPAGLAKARSAMASNGRSYRNGTGISAGTDVRPYIEMINSLPYGRKAGMDRQLLSIMSGRVSLFRTAYARGAFDSQRTVCKSYPNLWRVSMIA